MSGQDDLWKFRGAGKKECKKSPDGKHKWVTTAVGVHHQKEAQTYCLYCEQDKPE